MSSPAPRHSIDSSFTPTSPENRHAAFPFPPQDSSQRQAFPGRNLHRKGSASSLQSVSSVGGSLDFQNRLGSTVRETSQNAISTLLQPPIVRAGLLPHTQASATAAGYKAPTTRDIPPVTLTNIPQVPPDSFRDYLSRIGPLIETFQRGRAEPEQTHWLKKDKDLERTDRFAAALERRMSRDGSISPSFTRRSSTTLLSPVETPTTPTTRRKVSGQSRRNRNEPTPLSTIPSVYFEEDFHLENPRTFDVVSERAEIVRPAYGSPVSDFKHGNGAPPSPRKNLATNAILQEKLSWYMDTVEIHLINSISTASAGFFTALGSLKELQTEAEQSVSKIQRLREDLRRLDNEVAMGGLEVAAKKRRRENVKKLRKATEQVGMIVDTVKRADEAVDDGRYDDAVDRMDEVGKLARGQAIPGTAQEEGDLVDLRSLKALEGLQSGLLELQYRIGAGFAQRFTTTLLSDLRQHAERVPNSDTLKRWSRQRGIPPTYMETSDQLRTDLLAALKGLAKCGHTAAAVATFREAAIKEMKTIIRRHLPSSTDEDADSMISSSTRGGKALSQQEKSSILARNLRALDPEDAEKLLVNVYTAVGEALRRLSTQTKVLLDVTSQMQTLEPRKPSEQARRSADSPRPSSSHDSQSLRVSADEDLSQALDMSSLLGQAVDTAQTQITRVLKVRNEQTIRFSKDRFLRYFTLNRLFADECEAVSGRGGQALRGVINAQITGFVQLLGQAHMERIAASLDADKWDALDLSDEGEKMLGRILGSVERDASEWTASPPIWEPLLSTSDSIDSKSTTNGTSVLTTTTNGTGTARPQTRGAIIDSNKFILVASASALLPAMDTFLALTCVLPSLTPQISSSLLEVLRTFNSRSCQLILGAGATRSAGLKNITTKHLALASQALSFVIALIPYQRECVRRHLSGPTSGPGLAVLAEWDKTKRLYQDHQVGIHDKLVDIMSGRSQTHVKALMALDLDSAAADAAGEGKPSPYMETLIKETLTLHRVLARHLSAIEVSMIMRQIFANYKMQWTKAFADIEVKGIEGEKRLLRDVHAMEDRLGRIEEFKELGSEVVAVVKTRVGGEEKKAQVEKEEQDGEKNGEQVEKAAQVETVEKQATS